MKRIGLVLAMITLGLPAMLACAASDSMDADGEPGGGGGKEDGTGPGQGTRVKFSTTAQKGGLWELGNGNVFTAFQHGSEPMTYGRTRYLFQYGVVEPADTDTDDVQLLHAAGSCVQDSNNTGCEGGLMTPGSQKEWSIVSHDDRILIAQSKFVSSRHYHPRLMLIDPSGMEPAEVLAEFPNMVSEYPLGSTLVNYTVHHRLARLPTGNIVFSVSVDLDDPTAAPDRSFILDDDGMVLHEVAGYVTGYRSNPLELLVVTRPTGSQQAFSWWNPATQQTSPAGLVTVTAVYGTQIHPAVVRHDRGLVIRSSREDRVLRFSASGVLESDVTVPPTSELLGISPTGAALVWKSEAVAAGGWTWSLVLTKGDGTEQIIYDKPTLLADASWHFTSGAFGYPHLDKIVAPVIDDAGTMYVSFVQAASSYTDETYLVGFSGTGARLFGLELEGGGECIAQSVLPSQRLAAVCQHRVSNHLFLLGL